MQFADNYPLNKITTLQIGGPCKKFVIIKTEQELIEAIRFGKVNNLEFLVIGGGSNLLVSDEGVDKLIIKNDIAGINVIPTQAGIHQISVKAGTLLQDLVDYSIQNGLSGLQKMTGIPGTVGGAVYGNAGAYGQTISDRIAEVVAYDGQKVVTLSKDQCDFNYRDSGFKRNEYIILEVKFQLENGNPDTLEAEAKDVLSKRLVKYPKGIKCPGSFFKNIIAASLSEQILKQIPEDKITYGKLSAGYLLESVGAQGQVLDGIEIAPYHANLFINKGGGTAQAFYTLAKKYAEKVKQKFGITLEPEVQIINLPPL